MFMVGMLIGLAAFGMLGMALYTDGGPSACCRNCDKYPSQCSCLTDGKSMIEEEKE